MASLPHVHQVPQNTVQPPAQTPPAAVTPSTETASSPRLEVSSPQAQDTSSGPEQPRSEGRHFTEPKMPPDGGEHRELSVAFRAHCQDMELVRVSGLADLFHRLLERRWRPTPPWMRRKQHCRRSLTSLQRHIDRSLG